MVGKFENIFPLCLRVFWTGNYYMGRVIAYFILPVHRVLLTFDTDHTIDVLAMLNFFR